MPLTEPWAPGSWAWLALALGVLVAALAARRLAVLAATWRAMALTPVLSRHLARWVRARSYSDDDFFRADGAEDLWIRRRQAGLDRLAGILRTQFARSTAWGEAVRDSLSDLRFTDANRVPFPFARLMRERFPLCSVVTASDGPRLLDLDGRWTLDVSGSYGLNVAGFARYKAWIARGLERVRDLGPVLGPLHPVVADNLAMLRAVSGLDEVSFHMSGTEAVMAAVRLARFNTRSRLIVCFAGAYHGWWDGVQPGLGSERSLDDCLTLKDLHPASLGAIRRRARDIAAVVVNPVQSFHPNAPPPSDAVLLASGMRQAQDSTEDYARWLRALRAVCDECGIALIFDEVYTGFRLAPGGAQAYFGVQADMVVYGKSVAGGMPIGVVCGRTALMRRFDPDRPLRIAYVIGTFSAHPVVMGAMNEFQRWATEPSTAGEYEAMNRRCAEWAQMLEDKLLAAAHRMKADGWWPTAQEHPERERSMRAGLRREMLGSLVRVPPPLQRFHAEVMRRKVHDHHASHSHAVNQLFHVISSSAFLVCYALAFRDLTAAMWTGLAALFLRQIGHAILEPPCHDKEVALLGYTTRNKTLILGAYLVIPIAYLALAPSWSADALRSMAAPIALAWFTWTAVVVAGRVAYLAWTHGPRLALVWFVKLITDPVTDLLAYTPRFLPGRTRAEHP